MNYLNKTIKEVMDDYYDSPEFIEFKSDRKIRFYDEKFYHERDKQFYLLD